MNFIKAIIVAIVQGIAEFLPISSSGHIVLFKKILNFDIDMTFDIALHVGTLFAVVIVYRREIIEILAGPFRGKKQHSKLFNKELSNKNYFIIWLLFIVAIIPAGVAGLVLKDKIEELFHSSGTNSFFILAGFFVLTALLLLATKFIKVKKSRNIASMTFLQALTIGLFQALAIFPGVSRSGSTISAALFCGVDKEDAGRFSFIMSIPLILAAFLLDLKDFIDSGVSVSTEYIWIIVIGMITAFIAGYISLKLLINLLKRGKIWFFVIYMVVPIALSIFFALSK